VRELVRHCDRVGDAEADREEAHDEIARYFTSPEMQKQMTAMGAIVDIKDADEMRKIIPAEIKKWTQVAIEAGMPRHAQ
jgi:tripartite-type tricarboxylate transporter receptor subunit TctC